MKFWCITLTRVWDQKFCLVASVSSGLYMNCSSSLSLGTFAILMAGGVAGVVTWAFATPMDVVKARLQMSGAGGREYSGVLHCMRVSVREEGVRVFFKGLLLNSLRAFPVNAVTFLSYESLMKIFCPPARWHLPPRQWMDALNRSSHGVETGQDSSSDPVSGFMAHEEVRKVKGHLAAVGDLNTLWKPQLRVKSVVLDEIWARQLEANYTSLYKMWILMF